MFIYIQYNNRMSFTHLHTHSHYSLLTSLSKIDELIAHAKKNNMGSLALTDHANLYGAVEFYGKCRENNIKPIIGVCMYISSSSRFEKKPDPDNRVFTITLLAKNNTGYRNLLALVTKAHLEGLYYIPRIDKELLSKHAEGIIALSGDMWGGNPPRDVGERL